MYGKLETGAAIGDVVSGVKPVELVLLFSGPRPGVFEDSFPPSRVALGWVGTKARPADGAGGGPGGWILVFSTWLSPSKARVVLCGLSHFRGNRVFLAGLSGPPLSPPFAYNPGLRMVSIMRRISFHKQDWGLQNSWSAYYSHNVPV